MTLKPPSGVSDTIDTFSELDDRLPASTTRLGLASVLDAPYNAKCDGWLFFANITTATRTLTAVVGGPGNTYPAPAFVTADIGKLVFVTGAGVAGGDLRTTITAVAGNVATLAAVASTTVTTARCYYATDDTAAIQAFITAAMAGNFNTTRGGIMLLPTGSIGILGPLTIDAMNTKYKALRILGQGAGYSDSLGNGATQFLNFGTTSLLTCSSEVGGLEMGQFAVRNLRGIGDGVFTIDINQLVSQGWIHDINLLGAGNGGGNTGTLASIGSGIRIDRPANGSISVERMRVQYFDSPVNGAFKGSEGFRFGAELPNGVNSGNLKLGPLISMCTVGYRFIVSALFNGCSGGALKAVMSNGGTAGNYGFWFEGAQQAQNSLSACHAEQYTTPYYFNGCQNFVLNAPLASLPTGSRVGSVAFSFDGVAKGNKVIAGVSGSIETVASFGGTSSVNSVECRMLTGFTADTAMSAGTTKGDNTFINQDLTKWTALTLIGGVTSIKGGQDTAPPQCRINENGELELRGWISVDAAIAANGAVATVPAAYRTTFGAFFVAGFTDSVAANPSKVASLRVRPTSSGTPGEIQTQAALTITTNLVLDGVKVPAN